MDRHPTLSLRKGDATANVRMECLNPNTMKQYFDLLKNSLEEHGKMDSPAQIYNVVGMPRPSCTPPSGAGMPGLSHPPRLQLGHLDHPTYPCPELGDHPTYPCPELVLLDRPALPHQELARLDHPTLSRLELA